MRGILGFLAPSGKGYLSHLLTTQKEHGVVNKWMKEP